MTLDAVLTAFALVIFVVELQIPTLLPIPGVKLGLANVISLIAVFEIGALDALAILLVRIFLGGMFTGQMISIAYSLAGGLLCLLVTVILKKFVNKSQIWVCGVIGAIFHNLGQVAVAVLITKTPALVSYLPILMISGIVTGAFTGGIATLLSKRLHGLFARYIR